MIVRILKENGRVKIYCADTRNETGKDGNYIPVTAGY